jgi:hypothetical protein
MEMPPPVLFVGAFDARASAEEAQRELASRGIGSEARDADAPHHDPDDATILRSGGVRDLIENMLRGFLVDTRPVDRYADAAREGRWFVVARGVPARRDEVRDILGRSGRVEMLAGNSGAADTPVDAEVAVFGPDVAALPAGAAGRNEAREGATSTAPHGADPRRPRNDVEDASGLDSESRIRDSR